MMSDLVGGQISMAFDATPTAMPQVQAGAIRAIGAGMATRARALLHLPTLQEQGIKDCERAAGEDAGGYTPRIAEHPLAFLFKPQ